MPSLLAMNLPPQPSRQPANGRLSGLGVAWSMIGSVALGIGLGYGLDRWLGTSPWALTVCSMVFLAGGVYLVIREGSR